MEIARQTARRVPLLLAFAQNAPLLQWFSLQLVHVGACQLKLSLMEPVYRSLHVPLANITQAQTSVNLVNLSAQLAHTGLVTVLHAKLLLISTKTTVLVHA